MFSFVSIYKQQNKHNKPYTPYFFAIVVISGWFNISPCAIGEYASIAILFFWQYSTNSISVLLMWRRICFTITYRFKPFIGTIFAQNLYCQMRKPFIRCGSMPVFNTCRNINAVTWLHFYSFFTFFLIISSSGNAYQNLSTSTFCMMDMPVISALNWTTPSQSPGFTGLNAIQNCIFCTLFDEVLLLSIFPFLQHPILLLPD